MSYMMTCKWPLDKCHKWSKSSTACKRRQILLSQMISINNPLETFACLRHTQEKTTFEKLSNVSPSFFTWKARIFPLQSTILSETISLKQFLWINSLKQFPTFSFFICEHEQIHLGERLSLNVKVVWCHRYRRYIRVEKWPKAQFSCGVKADFIVFSFSPRVDISQLYL